MNNKKPADRYFPSICTLLMLIPLCGSPAMAASNVVTGTAGATGPAGAVGNPGQDAGDGTAGSGAIASATSGDPANTATATGGRGGNGGTGGFGFPLGSNGGQGGDGGDGGAALATAITNVATGSGAATATANGGEGGNGGIGGGAANGGIPGEGGDAGAGGLAAAAASVVNSGSGAATVNATAIGGDGNYGNYNSETVAGDGGDGGAALLGVVSGSSVSGEVSVTGRAFGGRGGEGYKSGNAGDGASVSLIDSVDGSTSGELILLQQARGGASGLVYTGENGIAGDAFSSLTKHASSSLLELDSLANAGIGGDRTATSGQAAAGGTATAVAIGSNDAGNVVLGADARGGGGGNARDGADGGDGGDAYLVTEATAIGDFGAYTDSSATGGNGGDVLNGNGSSGGSGGDADSHSSAVSTENAWITVSDSARGGFGGSVDSGTGSGGAGGHATSSASGSNAGEKRVYVAVEATGGSGGSGSGVGEAGASGGTADVAATGASTGGGYVWVEADVYGGAGGFGTNGAKGGAGADVDIVDVVSGSTAGRLQLDQSAVAGRGGAADTAAIGLGSAGNATSVLTATNHGGDNIEGSSSATGGAGASTLVSGASGDGGTGDAVIALTDAGDVKAVATARGGQGGQGTWGNAGHGGAAMLGVGGVGVRGVSTGGGSVDVQGNAFGGAGGRGVGNFAAGNGASISLLNAVDGETAGDLLLEQVAWGGSSGSVQNGLNGIAGDASSSLTKTASSNVLTVDSKATGGDGGERSGTSGKAAAGGDATAIAVAINTGGAARTNSGAANAVGGDGGSARGGNDSGDGGAATQSARAEAIGDYRSTAYGHALGGDGGTISTATGGVAGRGGDAISSSRAITTGDGTVFASDEATGGRGGSISSGLGAGGAGGAASSTASGINDGAQTVEVSAVTEGGSGGRGYGVGNSGGAAGVATQTSAVGTSTGGGAVIVTAEQEGGAGGSGSNGANGADGAASELVDAVKGYTSGELTLNQLATGGDGGGNAGGGTQAGAGGHAISSLSNSEAGTTSTAGRSMALGGNGGSASNGNNLSDAGAGGAASAAFALRSSGNAYVYARSIGGSGGNARDGDAGNGGAATLRVDDVGVSGESTSGGAVIVEGIAEGGDGGGANTLGNAGDGAAVSLVDQVDGDTSGHLWLMQTAVGGASGRAFNGQNGSAGDASSLLTKQVSSSSLRLGSAALGGAGGDRYDSSGKAANGGTAISVTHAVNDAGSAAAVSDFLTNAEGGRGGGGRNGADGGDGGAATQISSATALGGFDARAQGRAHGGSGGDVNGGHSATGGKGGDVTSQTSAYAVGGGDVESTDVAMAGSGGIALGALTTGGSGGMAVSSATGVGEKDTYVYSTAYGGSGGDRYDGGTAGLAGNGFATATGTGQSGSITAQAGTGVQDQLVSAVRTFAIADLSGTAVAGASAQFSGSGFSSGDAIDKQVTSLAYGAPDDNVVLPNVVGNAVLANFDIAGTTGAYTVYDSALLDSDVFGMGVLGGNYGLDGSGAPLAFTSMATFMVDTSQLTSGAQNLLVGFMNPVTTGAPFDDDDFQARFRIFSDDDYDSPVVDETFTDYTAFNSYFSGRTLDLGSTVTGNALRDFTFQFDVVSSDNPGAGIALDYVFGNSTITPRAVPFLPTTAYSLGDRHVGDTVVQNIEVSNSAVPGSDGLDAIFTGAGGDVSGITGSIEGLAAGGTDDTRLQMAMDTSTSGQKSGTAGIQLSTDGAVTGVTEVIGSADVTLGATVYDYAQAQINNVPVNVGNVRLGELAQANVSITNIAANDGYSEKLNGSVQSFAGDANGSGGFTGLGPSDTNDSGITVGIDSSAAGARSGTVKLALESDGTGINSLGTTTLASQDVQVEGAVFRLAQGEVTPNPLNLYARVGDTLSQALAVSNTALADGYSENLDVSASSTGNASVTGGPVSLSAGEMDSSAFTVLADTTSAGVTTGAVNMHYESNGQAWGLGPNVALAGQTVDVTTTVYAKAIASLTPTIDFGTVRRGSAAVSSLLVENTGAGALVDQLQETSRAVDSPFSVDAMTGGLDAGSSARLGVAMDTDDAGVFTGTASFGYASHNEYLADLVLGTQSVYFSGTVNNLAEAAFVNVEDTSGDGALSGTGNAYLLDFGSIFDTDVGAILSDELGVLNAANGPADLLAGAFSGYAGCGVFCQYGDLHTSDFSALAVGQIVNALFVSLDTTFLTTGVFEDTITLNPFSTLEGFEDLALAPIYLTLRINVRDTGGVPLPGTQLLIIVGFAVMFCSRLRNGRMPWRVRPRLISTCLLRRLRPWG